MTSGHPPIPPRARPEGTVPRVSIIVASYGRPSLLAGSLESALDQTYEDLEVIVCDDPAPRSCRDVIDSFNDGRLRPHFHPRNVGCWPNWTSAIRMARGEYLAFLGDDDRLSRDFVKRHVAALEANPAPDVSFCDLREVAESGADVRRVRPPFRPCGIVDSAALLEAVLHQEVFFGAALFRRKPAEAAWHRTEPDGIVADQGMLLRMALDPATRATYAEGAEYIKTVHAGQLSSQYVRVTELHLALMRRLTGSTPPGQPQKRLAHFTAHVGILLARHHAAHDNLPAARALFWDALRMAPSVPEAWSQLAQSYICPGRLRRTARQQRGLHSSDRRHGCSA